jgi:class 3 adenylate cyclase
MGKTFIFSMYLLIVISIIYLPLARANINFGLSEREIMDLIVGEVREVEAKLSNEGSCPMNCWYILDGSERFPAVENIQPGQKQIFRIIFKAPDCEEICGLHVLVHCIEKNDGKNCFGKEYHAESVLNLHYRPREFSGERKEPPLDEKRREEDPNKENTIGSLIGIILVVIFSSILIIFIVLLMIFGFYRLTRFLFFKSDREQSEEKCKRKLSAIMFTDMKGFSKGVSKEEENTLKKLWRYEKAMKSLIKEHDGRVVKTIGDAIMGDFDSAVNAVKSAIEIQRLLKKEDIKIRIGIHLGDVIHRAGDIFGDGVNIANRIESICKPGEVYISEDVYNQIKGKVDIKFESLGNMPLKNIESPPKIYRLK